MKIAFFVNVFPSPSETFILNQIIGLSERGHEVDIYAINQSDLQIVNTDVNRYGLMERTRYFYNHMPQNYFLRILKALGLIAQNDVWLHPMVLARALNILQYRRQATSLRLLYDVISVLRRKSYDVVHCQFGPLGPRILRLKQIGAITGKLITSFRGYDATRSLQQRSGIYDELFKEGDLFLPVSQAFRQRLIDVGCDARKIRVLHSGIDSAKFKYIEPRRSEDEITKVLTIARLVEKKGVSYAIQAIARLVAMGRRVIYHVVGDGALRNDLERLIESLGVGAEVRLLGWKSHDEVINLLQQAHVLIAPSVTAADGDQEGIPNALKEAMASGLPVVATYHSGIPEVVEDGVSGFLVPERDVDALTNRLDYLIDHPERWSILGRAGRLRIETDFDINKLNDQLVRLYTGDIPCC